MLFARGQSRRLAANLYMNSRPAEHQLRLIGASTSLSGGAMFKTILVPTDGSELSEKGAWRVIAVAG
jgi:hypothetical protein